MEYALNMTNGKLHEENCRHAKNSCVRTVSKSLLPVFREYGKRITCCKVCLKHDEAAKIAAENFNKNL